jgi:hypothetical protein
MSIMRRRWTAVVPAAAALALAGCGSSQTVTETGSHTTAHSSGATSRAAAVTACRGSQVALSYAGTEGATGHLEVTLAIRNLSARTCRMHGYPGARLLDRTGHSLPLRISRGHGFFPDTLAAPTTVTLAPRATAHFGLSFATNNEYAGARICRTVAAAVSAPPGPSVRWQRISLRAAPRISPCGDRLVISPVHA